MIITVTLEAPDGLGREVWKFRVNNNNGETPAIGFMLVYWANQVRETRRHKWQILGKHFDTYDREHCNTSVAPAVTDGVVMAFKEELMRRLTYTGVQG